MYTIKTVNYSTSLVRKSTSVQVEAMYASCGVYNGLSPHVFHPYTSSGLDNDETTS